MKAPNPLPAIAAVGKRITEIVGDQPSYGGRGIGNRRSYNEPARRHMKNSYKKNPTRMGMSDSRNPLLPAINRRLAK